MTHRNLVFFLSITILALSTIPAHAENSSESTLTPPVRNSTIRPIKKPKFEINKNPNRLNSSKSSELRPTGQARLDEARKNRLKKLTENFTNGFRHIIERLERVIAALEKRLNNLKDRGYNTTAAFANLDNAKIHLKSAKEHYELAKKALENASGSATPREFVKESHTHFSQTRAELKSVRDSLRKITTEISKIRPTVRQSVRLSITPKPTQGETVD